jgi:hypothetical protein
LNALFRYQLVWEETSKVYYDLINHEGWEKRNVVDVPVIQDLTTKVLSQHFNAKMLSANGLKIALLVMASAGFGFPFSWDAPPVAEDGSMSVQQAMTLLSSYATFGALLPKWAWNLPIQV